MYKYNIIKMKMKMKRALRIENHERRNSCGKVKFRNDPKAKGSVSGSKDHWKPSAGQAE
jgi:hypothetical protein